MKRLLNSLYVVSENTYLSLKNENVVLNAEDGSHKEVPLLGLQNIFCFSYKGASPALIGKCAEDGITLTFFTPTGRFLALPCGRSVGNVLLRKRQYEISVDENKCADVARWMLLGKIYNHRWILERALRDHAERVDKEKLESASAELKNAYSQLGEQKSLDSMRGIEGQAATAYFGAFDELVLNQKEDFCFTVRSRRPPLDRINAMLSFGYSLLASDCAGALEGVGLDSYMGFLHRIRSGRQSLALDLMEELRGVMVDRLVLSLINQKMVTKKDFREMENGAVLLDDDGRKTFLAQWQRKKQEEILHPFLKEKVAWGLVPHTQALLLARYLRGDLDAYPVFFWK